jgi:hypothetical protein
MTENNDVLLKLCGVIHNVSGKVNAVDSSMLSS